MNKGIILLAGIVLGCAAAQAVPAKPGLRTIVQPDGTTIQAELRGDEFCSFYVSSDGLPMRMSPDGYLRYVVAENTGNIPLSRKASDATPELAMRAFARIGASERIRMNAVPTENAAMAVAEHARALSESESGTEAWKGLGLMARQNFPVLGDIKSVVILVSYKDVDFTVTDPQRYYKDMLNKAGFNEYNAVGSARDFFVENSNGQFRPTFDVYGPVKLSRNRSYYGAETASGAHDSNPAMMVVEACAALDATVDFSQYDLDSDGIIDNIYVIYAGQGQASYGGPDTVWPHSSTIINGPVHDGVHIGRYATSNEWEYQRPDGIGTFVHEFSHVMGLPDLYSTSYVNSVTPGMWSTMDQGPYNGDGCCPPYYSAYERNALGWIDLKLVDGPMSVVMPAISENEAYLIPTKRNHEFFLLENRQRNGWDAEVPGHGMLVWHVDYDFTVFNRNNVNNDETHQYVDIVERKMNPNSSSAIIQATYPFPGSSIPYTRSIKPTTKPNLQPWVGPAIDLEITDIRESSGNVTFNVNGGRSSLDAPVATEATAAGAGGFTANWNGVEGATKYYLTVFGGKTTSDASEVADFGPADSQTVVLPEGWTFSGNDNDIYTIASACGESKPSLKFSGNGIELVTPLYKGQIETIEFFLRAAGVTSESIFEIQGRNSETEKWTPIDRISDLSDYNTRGEVFTSDIAAAAVRQVRFIFYTIKGRMALDDIKINLGSSYKEVVEGYNAKEITGATSHTVAITPDGNGIYTYYVEAAGEDGLHTSASNTITVDLSAYVSGVGNVAVDNSWNISVSGLTALYSGTPGATVKAVGASGATVASAVADAYGQASLSLPTAGFYIICAPEGNVKAIVR